MTRVSITPMGTAPSAIKATIDTLESLRMAGFKADAVGEDDTTITGVAENADFLKFAIERQGYARSIRILDVVVQGGNALKQL